MKYVITEAERREILGLYGIHREEKSPLQILSECKITLDGKFVVYDGAAYSCETGEQVPINEAWTFSDWAHTIGDVASAVSDFIVPGSGAIIDGVNGLSYFIEAMATKDPVKKKSLMIMGGITLAFIVIPGALQAVAIPLKQFVKTGKMIKNAAVASGVKLISKSMGNIMSAVPALVKKILDSNLGKKVLGKYGEYLSKYIDDIMKGVKAAFDDFGAAATKTGGKETAEKTIKEISLNSLTKKWKIPNCHNSGFCNTKEIFNTFKTKFNGLPKLFNPSQIKVNSRTLQTFVKDGQQMEREVIECVLPNNQKILMYKSSGANVATTGKQAGEWFTIPGMAQDGWFIKTKESINITKGGNKFMTEFAQFLEKNGSEGLGKSVVKDTAKAATKTVLDAVTSKSLLGFLRKGGTTVIKNGRKVLRKAGFAVGRSYRYMGPKGVTTVVIKEVTDDAVIITGKFGQAAPSIGTFLNQAVGAPWMRRGKSVYVPLFVKRFANMLLPDGSGINEEVLNQMPDADPDQTSQESLGYTNEEVAQYQGTQTSDQPVQYSVNPMVTHFQKALMSLGYNLPRFGVDGKFGPETQEQLRQFQQDYQLEGSLGKMDRTTAKMLAKALLDKNVQDSEDVQSALNAA